MTDLERRLVDDLTRRISSLETRFDRLDEKLDDSIVQMTRLASAVETLVRDRDGYVSRVEFQGLATHVHTRDAAMQWWMRMIVGAVVGAFATGAIGIVFALLGQGVTIP